MTNTPPALVFVLPGGGYTMRAEHEGEPVAEWLRAAGFAADVLAYPVAPARYPEAFDFVRSEIADARARFEGPIGVLGFSAGGHLAGHVAYAPADDPGSVPDFAILCYPVVTLGERGHQGSRDNLLGESLQLTTELSLENLVTPDAPPTFLWHTADDEAVSVSNALFLADALADNSVDFELHVYPSGTHGLGLATGTPVAGWTTLAATWLHALTNN